MITTTRLISLFIILVTISLNSIPLSLAQFNPNNMFDEVDDDLSIEGDIFNNFNEDLEASQVLKDERFYRYGRFFSVNMGLGMTRFTGNRGAAYQQNFDPTFTFSVTYFVDFLTAFSLGIDYSRHAMFIDTVVNGHVDRAIGTVDVSMLRPYLGLKFYMDTANYGNAITYSNPHLILRFEYWYQTNKFIDVRDLPNQTGGGLGGAIGFGLDFPIVIKESYFGFEFLYHWANLPDKFTQDYRAIPASDPNIPTYDDLMGNVWTVMVTYNITW
jgi:hypothetical protein